MKSFTQHRFAKPTVIVISAGIVATLALPANSFDSPAQATETVAAAPAQLLATAATGSALPTVELARDKYTATRPAPVRRTVAAANRFTVLNPPTQTYSGAAVVEFARQFVGKVPYGSGNNPKTSFSCDGLTQYVMAAFGVHLPRIVSNQAARMIRIPASKAQPGDFVVWPGHIGIYTGGGKVIDSPRPGRYVEHRAIWGNPQYMRLK